MVGNPQEHRSGLTAGQRKRAEAAFKPADRVVIHWRSRITGATGSGEAPVSRSFAEGMLKELDLQFPELEHWLEAFPEPDSPAAG